MCVCVRTGRFVIAFCFYGQSTISVMSKQKNKKKKVIKLQRIIIHVGSTFHTNINTQYLHSYMGVKHIFQNVVPSIWMYVYVRDMCQ